jgi:hypothetical protein
MDRIEAISDDMRAVVESEWPSWRTSCRSPSTDRFHGSEIELGLIEQGQLNLPAQGGDIGVLDDQLRSDLPCSRDVRPSGSPSM